MKVNFKYLFILLSLVLFYSLNTHISLAQSQVQEYYEKVKKYDKANGKVFSGLSERRTAEAEILSGTSPDKIKKPIQTQADMNNETYQTFKKTDKELNDVYKKILNKYKDDKVFISKLQKAELAWIKYRDAEIEAIYPDENDTTYGTVYPMCVNLIMAELIQQRIKELKLWLKGICEGDVCAGSRRWE